MALHMRTTKIRFKFQSSSWRQRRKMARNFLAILRHSLPLALRYCAGRVACPASFQPHPVGRDFFGLNVASSPTADLEDYHFERLRELGVTHVRTDYAYGSDLEPAERWIDRLTAAGFDVLIHLVQPSSQAARMHEPACRDAWADFLRHVFARFAGKVRLYEVGSTPNRQSWSGYSIEDYVAAFLIARDAAAASDAALIGPNVSDFAPYFMAALLAELRARGVRLPYISDNLFVDRAGQPENFDDHVLHPWTRRLHRLDVARKACVLDTLARQAGMGPPICTYVYWTINPDPSKVRRRYVTEEQYANHLVRYFVYSAAAGHLHRIYWGQMSGFFKGLIDDGARMRFDPPAVYQRLLNEGNAREYRKRPAFDAYRALIGQLAGSQFVRKWAAGESDAYVFEFEQAGTPLLVGWTKNGAQAPLRAILPDRPISRILDRDGAEQAIPSEIILTERPRYLLIANYE